MSLPVSFSVLSPVLALHCLFWCRRQCYRQYHFQCTRQFYGHDTCAGVFASVVSIFVALKLTLASSLESRPVPRWCHRDDTGTDADARIASSLTFNAATMTLTLVSSQVALVVTSPVSRMVPSLVSALVSTPLHFLIVFAMTLILVLFPVSPPVSPPVSFPASISVSSP